VAISLIGSTSLVGEKLSSSATIWFALLSIGGGVLVSPFLSRLASKRARATSILTARVPVFRYLRHGAINCRNFLGRVAWERAAENILCGLAFVFITERSDKIVFTDSYFRVGSNIPCDHKGIEYSGKGAGSWRGSEQRDLEPRTDLSGIEQSNAGYGIYCHRPTPNTHGLTIMLSPAYRAR
jgi:hypothetical protein